MATIEPRLMHLLNDPKANQFPPPDLPPIQGIPFSKSSGRSLPPLEPDAGLGSDKAIPKSQRPSQQQIPPIYSLADEGTSRQYPRNEGDYLKERPRQSSGHPLRMLLDDPDVNESTHSLRLILDDTSEITEDSSNKKRHRALTVKEDFVQLPQPLKKQKSSQNVVPPIINGLHDPPANANAAVFPPISSGSFDDNEKINLNPLKDFSVVEDRVASNSSTPIEADKSAAAKIKRRAAKPRRKWSEEETNHLLLGVSRHGVGKWTNILEDPDFKFNDRTAGDLKDRFRTCCPDEFRGSSGSKAPIQTKIATHASEAKSKLKAKTALLLENILAEPEEPPEREKTQSSQPDSDSAPKQRKSRAHRKKIEDLENLGIRGPFKKSHRRERRPFTEQDDKEILEGLDQYGPAWTKIQRDPRFNLSTRQPTDLRDRVRNKYPDIYTRIEKGSFQVKEPGRGSNLLEPSVSTTIETSFGPTKSGPLEPQLNRTSSKESMPKWPLSSNLLESAESLPGSQGFNLNESSNSAFIGSVGDMDISRLLLDDSQISTDN